MPISSEGPALRIGPPAASSWIRAAADEGSSGLASAPQPNETASAISAGDVTGSEISMARNYIPAPRGAQLRPRRPGWPGMRCPEPAHRSRTGHPGALDLGAHAAPLCESIGPGRSRSMGRLGQREDARPCPGPRASHRARARAAPAPGTGSGELRAREDLHAAGPRREARDKLTARRGPFPRRAR